MKMLLVISSLVIASSALASMNLKGKIMHNGQVIKLDQPVEHGKTYTYEQDQYLYEITPKKSKVADLHNLDVQIKKLDGTIARPEAKAQLHMKSNLESSVKTKSMDNTDPATLQLMLEEM